jgi:hypothetical protein
VRLNLITSDQPLCYSDNVDIFGDNTEALRKNTETLTNAGKEVGSQINVEKSKCMLLYCHQNAAQINDTKVAK